VALDREEIVVLTPRDRILFADIRKIPLLFGGRAPFNLDAVLAAAAALFVQDIPLETIERGLLTFHPSPDMLPGRMNLIDVGGFQVLLDYAHNAVGFQALRDFLASDERTKLGVIDAAGDRSDEEIRMLGKLAAETYDELFLYEGFDRRGRKSGEVLNLLAEGALEAGFPEGRLSRFDDPQAAWQAALGKGRPDLLVVLLSPRSRRTLEIIETSCLPSS